MEFYPGVKTVNENLEVIGKAGYRVISHFFAYKKLVDPLLYADKGEIPSMKRKYKDDEEALHILAAEE